MKKTIFVPLLMLCIINNCKAQLFTQTTKNALYITNLAKKFHVQAKPVDEAFTTSFFGLLMENVDNEKTIFLQSEFELLKQASTQLHIEVLTQKETFLNTLLKFTSVGAKRYDSIMQLVCSKPLNYTIKENYTVQEDTSFAKSIPDIYKKIEKKCKAQVLKMLLEDAKEYKANNVAFTKTSKDSAEREYRKKLGLQESRNFKQHFGSSTQTINYLSTIYCESLANTYDPHSEFFSQEGKTEFEEDLGGDKFALGIGVNDEESGLKIEHLKPGSVAFKSGLKKGDKIIGLQWEGEQKLDVSNASIEELDDHLGSNKQKPITLFIESSTGEQKQITLTKEKIEAIEEDRIASYVLNGKKKIGYILLPSFYTDYSSEVEGLNGCANDIGKEILKLKKENIEGLIIDVRNNGGGNLQEATDLIGLFINVGPVAQIQTNNPKIYTQKETNPGTLYNGSLAILVNEFSASASEYIAATLQDYNRALIIGSSTYGKATGQLFLPLDSSITYNMQDLSKVKNDNYFKVTTSKIYRVTGKTAQFTGVIPDIEIPSGLSDLPKENNLLNALVASNIAANKYFTPLPALPISYIKQQAKQVLDTCSILQNKLKLTQFIVNANKPQNVNLHWETALNHFVQEEETIKKMRDDKKQLQFFTPQNHLYTQTRLNADTFFTLFNKQVMEQLQMDNILQLAYLFTTFIP